jgi:hypothetical protein
MMMRTTNLSRMIVFCVLFAQTACFSLSRETPVLHQHRARRRWRESRRDRPSAMVA